MRTKPKESDNLEVLKLALVDAKSVMVAAARQCDVWARSTTDQTNSNRHLAKQLYIEAASINRTLQEP